jgi:hypothetical protein
MVFVEAREAGESGAPLLLSHPSLVERSASLPWEEEARGYRSKGLSANPFQEALRVIFEIRNPKSEIRNPKSEIRNPKSERTTSAHAARLTTSPLPVPVITW